MWKLLRPIVKEILLSIAAYAAYDAVADKGNNNESQDPYSYNEGLDIDDKNGNNIYLNTYFPDWELLNRETNKEYFSNYMLSNRAINEDELFDTYLGEYKGSFSTMTFRKSEISDFKSDTVYFEYLLLYDDSEQLKTGLAYFIPSVGTIEFEDPAFETALVAKIENDRNRMSYIYLSSFDLIYGDLLFINSRKLKSKTK